MIGKLFRYDFRIVAEKLIPFYVAVLAISIISKLVSIITHFNWEDFLNSETSGQVGFVFILGQLFLFMSFFIVIAGIILMTNFIMISRFHQSVYGSEGYLTNTLPLEPHQVIISKIFNFLCWLFISFVIIFISIAIIFPYDLGRMEWAGIITAFPYLLSIEDMALTIIFMLIAVFFSSVFDIIKLYLSVAFANLFTEYKLVMGIVGFIGITMITSTISYVLVFPLSFFLLKNDIITESTVLQSPMSNPANIFSLFLTFIFCIAGYFALLYLYKNKLNLE